MLLGALELKLEVDCLLKLFVERLVLLELGLVELLVLLLVLLLELRLVELGLVELLRLVVLLEVGWSC